MASTTTFAQARSAFHTRLLETILTLDVDGVASNADKSNGLSKKVAFGIANRLSVKTVGKKAAGQTAGDQFEAICTRFVEDTFLPLAHLRPGAWQVQQVTTSRNLAIAQYEQYAHLTDLAKAAKNNPALAAALGNDYTITPDIVVVRNTEPDSVINKPSYLVDGSVAKLASLRQANNGAPLLHASISCKWTLRSDRAQNARSEALNLIRNRKGRLPHIAVVTAEPMASRLASIALGTGDIDCVYHFALYELQATLKDLDLQDAADLLGIMVDGKRLKDISDLPLDLAT